MDEDSGCISFWNQELMENIVNCARYSISPLVQRILQKEQKKTFGYILDSVKDYLQGYSNFRKCFETEEKLTVALLYVLVIVFFLLVR